MALDEELIEFATNSHLKGDLQEAAKLCRQIIKETPQDVEALHLLGVILCDAGLYDQAFGVLEKALAIGGPNSSILHNFGVALQGQGEFRSASRAFRHAADAAPLRIDSWYALGEVYLLQDQLKGAVMAFEKVLELEPESVETRNNLGIALRKMGRLDEARNHLQKIANADPKNAAAQNNLGITETELNNVVAAKIAFQTALGVAPEYADAHYNLGNVYLAETEYETAAECYLQALDLEPGNCPAIYHLAICRQKQKAFEDALSLLNSLLEARGDNTEDDIQALGGRANVLRDLARFDEALVDIEAALALAPNDLAALGNKALTLQHAGKLDLAISTYRAALKSHPESEQLRTNLAQALLLDGQFKDGWQKFEGRLKSPVNVAKRENMPGQNWQGEDLTGKHILLWCEQGLGDTLQFMRYVPMVEAQAGEVTLVCPDRLRRLLQSFKTSATIVSADNSVPKTDYNAPLMSLPHLLNQHDVIEEGSYLSAEPDKIEQWGQKLGPSEKPRIGLAWQGNPNYEADHQRSLSLSSLKPLLARDGFQFISLQQGFGQEQLAEIVSEIIDLGATLDKESGFIDSAGVMANLDLVITSDTALPHLAGAMAVPVWLMLPKTPDWRWFLDRSDCPWYASMRLFRQTTAGDWSSVMDQITEALDQEEFV